MPELLPRLTVDGRERNPFPAHFDAVDRDEQQRVIREQHNKTQAGDTTFDYGLLLRGTPNQLYTLGCLGKFYHDQYGMIHARYVQFMSCVETESQIAPVGRLAAAADFQWIVTNDKSLADTNCILGVIATSETPIDGSFGWVIVDGIAPAVAILADPESVSVDLSVGWAASGEIGFDFEGSAIGFLAGEINTEIQPGALYIDIQQVNRRGIQAMISASQAGLISRLTAIESQLDEMAATTPADITELATRLEAQESKLALEEKTRARDIASVRNSVGDNAIDPAAISTAIEMIREEVRLELNDINSVISGIGYATLENRRDLTGLEVPPQSQIDNLVTQLSGFSVRFRDFPIVMTTPAVDGQVLTYNTAAGGWIPADLPAVVSSLNDLVDVDLATTPPATGESLVYDGTVWKPGP
jgi:hypothetical protein